MLFTTVLALGQAAHPSQLTSLPNQPEALVRSLYQQVVVRHPTGLPKGADMKIFAPYLSKTLLHRIDLARACSRDWIRQNQGRIVKPPFAWGEAGLFSGGDELTGPRAFQIGRTESEKDGSFRVHVTLKWWETTDRNADRWHVTQDRPVIWEVVAVVVPEDGNFAVDDVIYLKYKYINEYRLSEVLAKGCEGPHWVGFEAK